MAKQKKITIKSVFKFTALLLIALVYVLLIGRMSLAKVRGDMDSYLWTEKSSSAYLDAPDEYKILSAYLPAVIDEDTGYYHISNFTFVPSTGEVQLTVRYNNSTVRVLNDFYPEREKKQEDFVFVITDENGNVYKSYKYIASSNLLYNFRRVIFEGIDLENCGSLYFGIHYIDDANDLCPMTRRYKLIDSELINEDGYITESEIKVNYKNRGTKNYKDSPEFEYTIVNEEEGLK